MSKNAREQLVEIIKNEIYLSYDAFVPNRYDKEKIAEDISNDLMITINDHLLEEVRTAYLLTCMKDSLMAKEYPEGKCACIKCSPQHILVAISNLAKSMGWEKKEK